MQSTDVADLISEQASSIASDDVEFIVAMRLLRSYSLAEDVQDKASYTTIRSCTNGHSRTGRKVVGGVYAAGGDDSWVGGAGPIGEGEFKRASTLTACAAVLAMGDRTYASRADNVEKGIDRRRSSGEDQLERINRRTEYTSNGAT
ncbi:hypothetical protein K469DRAFT_696374 [Zopfia rhizophila CBS 207.26]|uniref:Uncharacterized protein n=1 Tax=Zopfia rhizophila CBS 207.26 TaxID=1314779 RepID=A0A6A6D803_9PEZI|nr:hypothetical protein K469DRAFT_696227 [Zopfia rhizophila CBS 207.26]KAF2177751.1 hypothetical protein K469DRAFT_696374 [Zopfia rhizophila CBS 207.26]